MSSLVSCNGVPAIVRRILLATALSVATTTLVVAPVRVDAQETSTTIVGQVVDRGGTPVPDAQVTILHVPSGTRRTTTTDAQGNFNASGLRVGGPFTIEAEKSGLTKASEADVFTTLGESFSVTLQMGGGQVLQEVVVAGRRDQDLALGVGTTFSSRDIANTPTISRDFRETLRSDPKIVIDPFNVDALEIAGTNNRFNSITVDGVRQSDDFGLNNNGFPTQRSPIALDAIEAVSLQTAPFDVEYSGFQGGTLNVVTRSGTNQFSGSAYFYTFQDSLVGDRSQDRNFTFTLDEKVIGATFGGPILKDRLFFFASYEKLESTQPIDFGPAGSNFPIIVSAIPQADFDRVISVAQSVYNFQAGNPASLGEIPEEDRKILVKLDWNISDDHRATLSYQDSSGNGIVTANNSTASRTLSTTSQWYNRAFPLKQYALQVYSTWNDRLSTEFEAGRKEVTGIQDSLSGTDFGEIRVCNAVTAPPQIGPFPGGGTCPTGTIYLGSDEFRHGNRLANDLNQFKVKAEYQIGSHLIKAGIELETLEIFNLFLPRSEGVWIFNSIDQFAARQAARFQYQNAFTNNKADGAARFGYDTWSVYLQDEWTVSPEFTLQYGLRYDRYRSDDRPQLNQNFVSRQGFANTETLDGRDLISPRIGFNWRPLDRTTVRGGVGIFGGGSPNVWISNSFSNDGVTIVSQTIDRPASPTAVLTPVQAAALNGVTGFTIGQAVLDANTALRGNGSVNAVDPGFDIPSSWKWNLGIDQRFDVPWLGNDWRFSADAIYTKGRAAALWRDLRLNRTGTAPDGRPIYSQLNNQNLNDLVLYSVEAGESMVVSLNLEKTWRTRAGRFDFSVGYGYQDVKDINSATSSTALSNWDNLAAADVNNPAEATSNYEIRHRFPLTLTWRKNFFGDYGTTASLFIERRSGRPFSYTFGGQTTLFGDPRQGARTRQLFYVPRDQNEVGFSGGLTWDQLNSFIEGSGLDEYRGQIAPRNAFTSPWITFSDLKLSQEIPAFFKGARGIFEVNIKNVANLINSDWGRVEQVGFPYVSPVVNASVVNGRYVYSPIPGQTGPRPVNFTTSALSSVWRVQLGVKFTF